jgi:hypothetical protein
MTLTDWRLSANPTRISWFAAERCQKVLVLVAVGVGELAGVTAACR